MCSPFRHRNACETKSCKREKTQFWLMVLHFNGTQTINLRIHMPSEANYGQFIVDANISITAAE